MIEYTTAWFAIAYHISQKVIKKKDAKTFVVRRRLKLAYCKQIIFRSEKDSRHLNFYFRMCVRRRIRLIIYAWIDVHNGNSSTIKLLMPLDYPIIFRKQHEFYHTLRQTHHYAVFLLGFIGSQSSRLGHDIEK